MLDILAVSNETLGIFKCSDTAIVSAAPSVTIVVRFLFNSGKKLIPYSELNTLARAGANLYLGCCS